MWDRQPRESAKAYSAFLDYCRMGPGRSLGKLHAQYCGQTEGGAGAGIPPTRRLATLERWSSRYGWQKRVEAWDAEQQRQEQELWEERRRLVQEADWQMGEELRALAQAILEQTPQFVKTTRRLIRGKKGQPDREVITLGIDVTGLVKAADSGSKLQRLAAGMPDSVQQYQVTRTLEITADDLAAARERALKFEQEILGDDGNSGTPKD